MTPDDAVEALSALALGCNDWTADKFELWTRMVVEKCADASAVRLACEQWVTTTDSTFVPAFGTWYALYREIRIRRGGNRPAIGTGDGISLSQHLRQLAVRAINGNRDAEEEIGRWRHFADQFPAGSPFGDESWRQVLKDIA